METIKFWLSTIGVLALLGGLGYFAFTSIDSGSEHVNQQKIKELQSENEDLVKQVESLEKKLEGYEPKIVKEPIFETKPPVQTEPPKTTTPAVYKYAKLIAELEALVADNVQMKLKSRGTRVGTVQNFFNLYNNTTNKVDNDYGESTKKQLVLFKRRWD